MCYKKISLALVLCANFIFSTQAAHTRLHIALCTADTREHVKVQARIELYTAIHDATNLTEKQILAAFHYYMGIMSQQVMKIHATHAGIIACLIAKPYCATITLMDHISGATEAAYIAAMHESKILQKYINAQDDTEAGNNNTALHYAARMGLLEIVGLLTMCNADGHLKNNTFDTPLFCALKYFPKQAGESDINDTHFPLQHRETEAFVGIADHLSFVTLVTTDEQRSRLHILRDQVLLDTVCSEDQTPLQLIAERPLAQHLLGHLMH